jgi:hypothetical protein
MTSRAGKWGEAAAAAAAAAAHQGTGEGRYVAGPGGQRVAVAAVWL